MKRNILHLLCMKKIIDIYYLKCFLMNKVDIKAKDLYGNTPLHYACYNKKITLSILNAHCVAFARNVSNDVE